MNFIALFRQGVRANNFFGNKMSHAPNFLKEKVKTDYCRRISNCDALYRYEGVLLRRQFNIQQERVCSF